MTEQTKKQLPQISINGRGLQLTTLDEGYRFAKYVLASGFAPREFDTPEKIFVAMQYGWELGLRPMQALRTIAVINGRPSLWGDALPALVQRTGQCEYIKEYFEGEQFNDNYAAVCETKRRDQSSPVVRRFSVGDAKRAKLWGKAGPWQGYPQRMLQMRARAWCFRDNFADAIGGLAVAEEVMDIPAESWTPITEHQQPEANEIDDLVAGHSVSRASHVMRAVDDTDDQSQLEQIENEIDELAASGEWTLEEVGQVKNRITLRRRELEAEKVEA